MNPSIIIIIIINESFIITVYRFTAVSLPHYLSRHLKKQVSSTDWSWPQGLRAYLRRRSTTVSNEASEEICHSGHRGFGGDLPQWVGGTETFGRRCSPTTNQGMLPL